MARVDAGHIIFNEVRDAEVIKAFAIKAGNEQLIGFNELHWKRGVVPDTYDNFMISWVNEEGFRVAREVIEILYAATASSDA